MSIDIRDNFEIESFYRDMVEDSNGSCDNNQDEIEFPRRIQIDKIDNIVFDQIDYEDYPDFTDAYVQSADMNGIPMNEEELDNLNDHFREFIYEKLIDYLF